MPNLSDVTIIAAWRYRNEIGRIDRIHYTVRRADGGKRHCYVDPPNALYKVLDEHLQAIGYTGPKPRKQAAA